MTDVDVSTERSYGCSYACGNPYDFVVITITDGSTLFLCSPCFIQTAAEMLEAMMNPENSAVAKKVREAKVGELAPMLEGGVRKRGHNAPAETTDPDAIEAFEGFVLPDELPDAMQPQ